jgi:hypothetical protein
VKRTLWLIVSCILLITITACNSTNEELNNIEVKANQQILPSILTKSNDNKQEIANLGSLDSFNTLIKQTNKELPYIKLGESITITFNQLNNITMPPDSYELTGYILDQDGHVKYKQEEELTSHIKFNKTQASFPLSENMLAYASSNSKDYEPGATIRGFKLSSTWGDQVYDVFFVLHTDVKP